MRTGDITRDAIIENCVQNLNLSYGDGIPTITSDELWRRLSPQTLNQAFDFVGRVIKFQAEGKTSLKRVMQQTLIESPKTSVLDGGFGGRGGKDKFQHW